MFQTDLNLWLQSAFEGGWMFSLMTAISALGYAPAYMLLVAVCAFGFKLRPGLAILLAILLMSGAASMIKQAAQLPRPSDVDARVLDKDRSGHHLIDHGSAASFWALPTDEAVAAFRNQREPDPGFLSGHVGVATSACIALLLGFGVRRWPLRLLLILGWPLLMAVSRMYLGRHFLADVLAGWLLGGAVAHLAVWLLPAWQSRREGLRLALVAALAGVWVALAWRSSWIGVDSAGQLAGLALTLLWLRWRGSPADATAAGPRIARVTLFVGLNLLAIPVIDGIASALALPDTRAVGVLCYLVGTVLVMVLSIESCRLPWLQQRRPAHAEPAQR